MPNIPANRAVAIATAVAGLLGVLAPLIADLDTSSTATLIAGLAVIFGASAQWMRGWQKHEAYQAEANTAHRDVTAPLFGSGQVSISLSEDPEVDDVPADELPSDEEELAAPPPRSMGY